MESKTPQGEDVRTCNPPRGSARWEGFSATATAIVPPDIRALPGIRAARDHHRRFPGAQMPSDAKSAATARLSPKWLTVRPGRTAPHRGASIPRTAEPAEVSKV
jgi:hypothetical protein